MEVSVIVFICVLFALLFATICYCFLRFHNSEFKPEDRIEANCNRSSSRLQNRRPTAPRCRRSPKLGPIGAGASTTDGHPVSPIPPDIHLYRSAPYPVTISPYPPEPPPTGFGYPAAFEAEHSRWSPYFPHPPTVENSCPYPLRPPVNMPHPQHSNADEPFYPLHTNSDLPESVIIINERDRSNIPVQVLYPVAMPQMSVNSLPVQRVNQRSSDSPPPSYAEAVRESYPPAAQHNCNEGFLGYRSYR